MFLPGQNLFSFRNFVVSSEKLLLVKENILSDFVELLPVTMVEEKKAKQKGLAKQTLEVARDALDDTDVDFDPLIWWPSHPEYTLLYPVAKMLLQIPLSSAENERSFSSASFVLDQRRTRLDIDNFRREHRIRRALCSGTTPQEKLERSNELIERFSQSLDEARMAARAAAPH
jgi:hypothetical protein